MATQALRTPDGHICGEKHHRARWPDSVVVLAIDTHVVYGFGHVKVARELARYGYLVSAYTVKDWLVGKRRAYVRRG